MALVQARRNVHRDQKKRVWWFATEKNDIFRALSELRVQFEGTPRCSQQLENVIYKPHRKPETFVTSAYLIDLVEVMPIPCTSE